MLIEMPIIAVNISKILKNKWVVNIVIPPHFKEYLRNLKFTKISIKNKITKVNNNILENAFAKNISDIGNKKINNIVEKLVKSSIVHLIISFTPRLFLFSPS